MIYRKKLHYFIVTLLLLSSTFIHATTPGTMTIKLLGINDFHGQISTGKFINNEPVGGAAVLASYLKQAQSGMEDKTIITIMGDLVSASPPASGLLHDEPSILFMNSLGNDHCSAEARMDPLCNIVATVGNHEFDKGQKAMFDLMYGTNNPPTNDWYPSPSYQGATYPYISANIINAKTEKPLFPPYTIKLVNNIPVAFIGAVLKNAADTMLPENAEGVQFLDEAEAINHYIPEIKSKGVKIIIVLIHEGGHQIPYEGETKANTKVEGDINEIVNRLDDDVDVVMAGHTHQFLNAFIPNHNGVNILVTEANSYSASFAEVTLQVDEKSHKVIKKSAQIITTYANQWPGTMPDEQIQKLVQLAENNVEPIINSYVGTLASPLSKKQNEHGESNLGNLIADAFRIMMETDIGLTNLHGIRDDMHAGTVTWGAVYSVQPFSNNMVAITLTGKEIYELFEEQWKGSSPNILQISGLTYTYDLQQPIGHRVVTINHLGQPLIKEKTYTIATTNYLASGGGTFSVMKKAKIIRIGDNDHDTVINYIKQLPQPFAVAIEGRMKNVSQ